MYLTHPTERHNAFNNFPLHLCQQRHPSQKSGARLLKKKGRSPVLAKAKGTLPGTAFSRHNIYMSYPPGSAARRWILNPYSLYDFTQFSVKQPFSGNTITIKPCNALCCNGRNSMSRTPFVITTHTFTPFESALNENSLDSSRHVTPCHFFMHFLKLFRFCSPISQPNRTTVSLQYKTWKHATALQLPFAGRLLIWEHCTDPQFIFLTVPLMLNQ